MGGNYWYLHFFYFLFPSYFFTLIRFLMVFKTSTLRWYFDPLRPLLDKPQTDLMILGCEDIPSFKRPMTRSISDWLASQLGTIGDENGASPTPPKSGFSELVIFGDESLKAFDCKGVTLATPTSPDGVLPSELGTTGATRVAL